MEAIKGVNDVIQLWLHESSRVYHDKLIDEKDMKMFNDLAIDATKKHFEVADFLFCSIHLHEKKNLFSNYLF